MAAGADAGKAARAAAPAAIVGAEEKTPPTTLSSGASRKPAKPLFIFAKIPSF